jgi:mycothiol system anti-sigma-R factor
MNCHRVREAMFLVTDNELEPELLAPFREHLSFCPACASHFHYLEKLVCLIRQRCSRVSAPSRVKVRILSSFPHRGGVSPEVLE